jgi:hypothetical protein
MSTADLGPFSAGVANWRKILAAMPDLEGRWQVFDEAAHDVAGYVTKGLDRGVAADELHDIATGNGLADPDMVQQIMADAFRDVQQAKYQQEAPPPHINGRGKEKPAQPLKIMSKAEFIKGFVAPDYLIEGLLQRRFIYALTGQTGHAKTAVALLIARLVSCADYNTTLGPHRVDKGRVLYFVGENPDDVRMRVIGSDAKRSDDVTADNVAFIPGIFDISQMFGVLEHTIKQSGDVSMIIVDTSAAYFLGNEELSNTQMGAYARLLRRHTTSQAGRPCLCSAIRSSYCSSRRNYCLEGGGAYLAGDGRNLTPGRKRTRWSSFYYNKMRGPGFQPLSFKLENHQDAEAFDCKGREISTGRRSQSHSAKRKRQKRGTKTTEGITSSPPCCKRPTAHFKNGQSTSVGKPTPVPSTRKRSSASSPGSPSPSRSSPGASAGIGCSPTRAKSKPARRHSALSARRSPTAKGHCFEPGTLDC